MVNRGVSPWNLLEYSGPLWTLSVIWGIVNGFFGGRPVMT